MSEDNVGLSMRGKMLGVLMRDARQARGQSPEACAAAIGAEPEAYAAFERGEASPSLPELELFAYFLDVPLAHFWGERVLATAPEAGDHQLPAADVTLLRNRIIGLQLRQAREASGLSVEALAAAAGLPAEHLAAYEWGQWAVPLPTLEALANRLGLPVDHFFAAEGPVGDWDTLHRAAERVRQLPPDLRDFLSRPANESYLRLAHRLSQLSVDRLRGIAESLLEITY